MHLLYPSIHIMEKNANLNWQEAFIWFHAFPSFTADDML